MAKKTKKSVKRTTATKSATKARAPTAAARAAARRRAPAKANRARASAKPRKVSPIPPGVHTVTPNLVLEDCAKAMEFYKQAFGAKELMRMMSPDGRGIWHAEMRIGDSIIYLNDAMDRRAPSRENPSSTMIWLYVPDCDAVFARAIEAGATSAMPLADMFWGDRSGMVIDPFGMPWGISTHVKDLSEEEMRRAGEEFAKKMATQGGGQGTAGAAT
ncbi:MAG TPA: VOC family protein [Anaeromyxobacteraceae bacterium]